MITDKKTYVKIEYKKWNQAIEYGIEHNIMKEFLEQNGSEVHNMLLESWNMDEALAVSKEEGFEDGYELGEQRGRAYGEKKKQEDLIRALRDVLPVETIAEKFNLSKEYVLDVLKQDMCVCEPEHPYTATK